MEKSKKANGMLKYKLGEDVDVGLLGCDAVRTGHLHGVAIENTSISTVY
jgi:hypothetical protein